LEHQPYFLIALEGGGTRSQAALFNGTGRLRQTCDAGAVNTNFVSVEQARQAVRQAVTGVLAAAEVAAAAVGHAGAGPARHRSHRSWADELTKGGQRAAAGGVRVSFAQIRQ
jgi:N-acetylglucosamine kinase-like BadF-type ATPase